MKRTLQALLLALVAIMMPIGAWAEDFESGGIYYNITSSKNKTVEVTYRGNSYSEYKEYSNEVTIPASVTYDGITYSVTSIGNYSFYNCSSLTSISIPGTVTSMGESAFMDCTLLGSVTLCEGVTSIGNSAFYRCTSLSSISIPGTVTSIGEGAFSSCFKLSNVTLSEGLTSIGEYMFSGCSSLDSISIPGTVTSIGDDAFSNCSSLEDVHYFGTEEQWGSITIGSSNSPLTQATIHYYENGICTEHGEYQPAMLNAEGYYEISNAGQLYWFAQQVNIGGKTTANALLTADIDLENRVWYPIGLNGEKAQENGENVVAHYGGIFDGNGHTVSNFTVTGNRNSAL